MREAKGSVFSGVAVLGAALGRARTKLGHRSNSEAGRRISFSEDPADAANYSAEDWHKAGSSPPQVPSPREARSGSLAESVVMNMGMVRGSRRSSFTGSAVGSVLSLGVSAQDSCNSAAAPASFLDALNTSTAGASGDGIRPASPSTSGLPRPKCTALALLAKSSMPRAEVSKFGVHVRKVFGEIGAMKELPKAVCVKVPDVVGFMSCQHGAVIFEEGHEPDCCFVVLQGRVQLWRQAYECDVPFPAEEGSAAARKHCTAIAGMLTKLAGRRDGQQEGGGGDARGQRASRPAVQNYGSIIASCGPGTMFGDAELLEHQPRLATAVVCSDTCEMLVMARSDFDSMLRAALLQAELTKVSWHIQQLLMQFNFFQRIERDVQASIAEVMHFAYARKGEVLFRQGDPPGHCYIVLAGDVGIWVDGLEDAPPAPRLTRQQSSASLLAGSRDVEDSGGPQRAATPGGGPGFLSRQNSQASVVPELPPKRSTVTQVPILPNRDAGNQVARQKCHAILGPLRRLHALKRMAAEVDGPGPGTDSDVVHELSQRAKQVAWLGPGKMFGELALLEDQPRSATVMCMEDCAFLTIEGSDFERVLKKAMNEAVMSLPILAEPLLKELPFFQKLRPTVQQRVRHILKYKTAKRGAVLFWESSPPERCYFLLSGQVSCYRQVDSKGPSSYSGRGSELPPESVTEKCAELASRLKQVAHPDESKEEQRRRLSDAVYQHFGERRAMERRGSLTEVMGRPEAVLREGAVFNEHSLLMDVPCEVSVTCDKDCQFLEIEKAQFDQVVKEDVIRLKVQELQMQVKRLFRGFPLFEDMGKSVQETAPEIARYHFERAGSLLFKEGDVAELCYIILRGEVTIWRRAKGAGGSKNRQGSEQWELSLLADDATIEDAPPSSGETEEEEEEEEENELEDIDGEEDAIDDFGSEESSQAAEEGAGSPRVQDAREAQRPPLTRAHPDAYERCIQLASRLEPVSCCVRSGKRAKDEERRRGETAVASLGPGSLFGEWALLNNDPRSATVTCHTDCEFLVIEKCDFDRVVKQEMAKAKQEKLEFLHAYVPGIKQMSSRKMDVMLKCFERKMVPLNHVFMEQGQIGDGSVYFVWRGSVEFYTTCFPQGQGGERALLPEKGFRRLRVLIKGGVFGAVPVKAKLPFTAVARSSPCEVLMVTFEHLKQLPDVVMKGLRKLIDQTTAWLSDTPSADKPSGTLDRSGSRTASQGASRGASRSGARCAGSSAWGGSGAAALPSLQVPRPQSSKIPRPLSGKIPRPLDGKFPGLLLGSKGAHHASAQPLGRGLAVSWGSGLFRRERGAEDGHEEFDIQPGELLALRGSRPRRRDEMPSGVLRSPSSGVGGKSVGLSKSVSLPSMQGAPNR